MPNPLTRLGAMNVGRKPVDRSIPTGAITPVPERVAGTVFAYRGMETHGVDVKHGDEAVSEELWRDAADYDQEYEEPEPEPTVVPVRIVQEDSIEVKRGTITQLPVPAAGQPTQIIGNDFSNRARILTRIQNIGTQIIYIGTDMSSAGPISGWPLAAGTTFESATHEGFWAVSSDASQGKVAVYVAYTVNATHDR
jgi:hypothetical protein